MPNVCPSHVSQIHLLFQSIYFLKSIYNILGIIDLLRAHNWPIQRSQNYLPHIVIHDRNILVYHGIYQHLMLCSLLIARRLNNVCHQCLVDVWLLVFSLVYPRISNELHIPSHLANFPSSSTTSGGRIDKLLILPLLLHMLWTHKISYTWGCSHTSNCTRSPLLSLLSLWPPL